MNVSKISPEVRDELDLKPLSVKNVSSSQVFKIIADGSEESLHTDFKLPTEQYGVYTVLMRDFIYAMMTFQVHGFEDNRGGHGIRHPKIDPERVRFITNNFHVPSFGQVCYGLNPKTGRMEIADGHNRSQGGFNCYTQGKMTEEQLNSKISIQFVEDFLTVYHNAGRAKPHSTSDRLKNKHTVFGAIINQDLMSKLSPMAAEWLTGRSKVTSVLRDLLYGSETVTNPEEWSVKNVYTRGGNAFLRELERMPAGYWKVSDPNLQRVAHAINSYVQVICIYKAHESKKVVKILDNITGSGGFFFFYVFDQLSSRPRLNNIAELAEKMGDEYRSLEDGATAFLRGDKHTYNNRLEDLYDLLT